MLLSHLPQPFLFIFIRSILFLVTLCEADWDCQSLHNLEGSGHGPWSLQHLQYLA